MTEALASRVSCAGCAWRAPDDEPYPFRCANVGKPGFEDTDHVLARVLDLSRVEWPGGGEANPFLRYRILFHSYHLATGHGLSDAEYVELVEGLDRAVAGVDGHGFAATPFAAAPDLARRSGLSARGALWVKDETGNVSGSHKARHLFGLLVHLEVAERLGLAPGRERPPLAIASCGNAALAAAVVARAGRRELRVFVPTDADPAIVARLKELDAHVEVCTRDPSVPGDPTYHALQHAVRDGALPFTCQGNENGLAIEGGLTIGYEIASTLAEEGASLDRVIAQVGGGALASAVVQGLREAARLGAIEGVPTLHAVQTRGAFPLQRAFERIGALAGERSPTDALRHAETHRSEFMWPWEETHHSVAHGILDDETYDWAAVVRGMIETGGSPVVVDEDTLEEANRMAVEATGIPVDHTGSAGLAGLIALRRRGGIGKDDRVAVLFTGARRAGGEGGKG